MNPAIRRTCTLIWLLVPALLAAGPAYAAPGDPHVVYTANNFADGAVVLRADPTTGAVVEVSRNGTQGTLFHRPFDLAVEADGNLVVADMGAPNAKDGSVIRVDPLTGRQSLVSSGDRFYDPAGIAVAPNGDLYVADNFAPDNDGAVIRVDPRTGAQTLVASAGLLDLPFGIAVAGDGTLVVSNRVEDGALPGNCPPTGSVVQVNPVNGVQTLISQGGLLSFPLGLALASDGTVLVANECEGAAGVVRLRRAGQAWTQGAVTSNGSSDVLRTPERIALDPAGVPLVSDFALGGEGEGGIARVDPVSSAQGLVAGGALFNHPLGIATVVNRPPSASLVPTPALVAAGRPVRFDGSSSRDPEGQRLLYEWDLDGDGSFEAASGATAVADRMFGVEGRATVRVRVSDPHGASAVAEAAVAVDGSRPMVTRLRTGARALRVGPARRKRSRRPAAARRPRRAPKSTKLRFVLSEPAALTVSVERARSGRRKRGGRCRPRAKRGRRCRVWSQARQIERLVGAGPGAIRVRARGLRPGRFRLDVTAVDGVGHRSPRRRLPLRVVRLRKVTKKGD